MTPLNKTIHLFLQTLDNLKDKNLVVGYSGGADSSALLHLLKEKQAFFGYQLKAVFFSHEGSPLIEEEDKLIVHCQSTCKDLQIPLLVEPLYLEKQKNQSWESSGRIARMNFYKANKPDYVFLGHHKDDQNETTMMQLFRGAGKGIMAMKKVENFYCRPFLDIHKGEIYQYLKSKNIPWIEDSTNSHNEFTRNFWRNIAIPTIEKYYPQYSQQLDTLRQKTQENIQLVHELAKIDGLDNLLKMQTVDISQMSLLRIKNLVINYFNHHKTGLDKLYLENQINQYKANKNCIIQKNEIHLTLDRHQMTSLMVNESNLKNSINKL